jgi:prolyl-tRNA synthetase
LEDLDIYYDKVLQSYLNIFKSCGLGEVTYLTLASGGTFSKYSHEFQTLTESGEDIIYLCKKCNFAINKEIIDEQGEECPKCHNQNLSQEKAIEVGNIFKLMDRFSGAFNVRYHDSLGKEKDIFMGCYGIGSSRLIGAIVETFHDQFGIIWPYQVAPFHIHLLSLCQEPEEQAQVESSFV